HHCNDISVAQTIGDVPAHADNNDLGVELSLRIDRVTVLAFGHRASPSATQSSRRPLLHRNRHKPRLRILNARTALESRHHRLLWQNFAVTIAFEPTVQMVGQEVCPGPTFQALTA